jgi:hypothetical protein
MPGCFSPASLSLLGCRAPPASVTPCAGADGPPWLSELSSKPQPAFKKNFQDSHPGERGHFVYVSKVSALMPSAVRGVRADPIPQGGGYSHKLSVRAASLGATGGCLSPTLSAGAFADRSKGEGLSQL